MNEKTRKPKKDGKTRKEPYKFNPTKRAKYLQLLREGEFKKDASAAVGVSRFAIYCHAKIDQEFAQQEALAYDEGQVLKYTEMNEEVTEALYDAATSGNVTAAIFWAKCRLGWVETSRQEITGKDGEPLEFGKVESLTDEQLERIIKSRTG